MLPEFYKYHGTGNDFILMDCRSEKVVLSTAQIAHLCDRHFGIGADGFMYLQHEPGYDFRMVYFNADGRESTMCGNGGRCIVAFAHQLGIINDKANFIAIDGPHTATIENDIIHLNMTDVIMVEHHDGYSVLNTGSPHYVTWVDNIAHANVFAAGRKIRNEKKHQPDGINVNFAQWVNEVLHVRTYERGVEDETLSCGTGVVASAIVATKDKTGDFVIPIHAPGGDLRVSFIKDTSGSARQVILSGPATFVFKGVMAL